MTRAAKRKEWEVRIAAFRGSGQSVGKWCEANGIKEHSLRYWMHRVGAGESNESLTPQWLSVEVEGTSSPSKSPLHIRVGQATIEVKPGFDPILLKEVVQALC